MDLGIVTPVLTLLPGAHARWEEDAAFTDVVTVVQAADRLGYHHCTCSEHVAVPVAVAEVRGGRYYDPLAVFGALAAHTTAIRFATHVLVLGYHHPLEIAKRYGTLDVVSGGRIVLGVGVGSLAEEFALLDAPFTDRGPRADDALRALRAALSQRIPEYTGEPYAFGGMIVEPHAVQSPVPLWVGGRTFRSWRRAVELGDGWAPFGLRTAEIAAMRDRLPPPTDRPFAVVLQPERPLDPGAEPNRTAEQLGRFAAAGATAVNARFVHRSVAHYVDQLEALVAVRAGL
ncbi:MAG: TIGR03619 family F420-dependent LLM class oxidoreductase [Actinomycetota bacterium]